MTKKLGKIKPRVNPDGDISREDARKIAQEIYQMYDVTAKIAVDLGKDEEYFMLNPADWRNDPNWMAQEMYTGMLLSGYEDSIRNYNEALKMCGTNLSKYGQTAAIREKYGKRKGPPMSAKNCSIGRKVVWDGEEYVVNKGHRWSKVGGLTKRKSPKRKSPKRKSPKRKSPKHKSSKRKSPKKTVAQRRKECKAQGLVYDTKTKRCRESKRKRRKSPKRKSAKRKSPKRKSPKKTVAQRRKECKAQGLVYDTKTKRCRESKRKRRKSPKRKSPTRG